MKPLNAYQVQKLAREISTFKGARLQEVSQSDAILLLGLYTDRLHWLAVDMDPVAPFIAYVPDARELKPFHAVKRPISLFIRAHLLDQRLVGVEAPADLGRVIRLQFSGATEEGAQIEIRLFPRGQNVLVHKTGKKAVAWSKPQALAAMNPEQAKTALEPLSFSWDLESTHWLQEKFRGTGEKTKASEPTLVRPLTDLAAEKIAKINKALQKVRFDLEQKKSQRYSEAGEWLKENQSLEVPSEFVKWIEPKKSLNWNIANAFKKAKDLKVKIKGAEARVLVLLNQIESLKAQPELATQKASIEKVSSSKNLLHMSSARGRTFELTNGLRLYVGKSAADNMKLLREARPWYFWLHLKDEPGAHAILHRNKSQKVSDEELHVAAHHLVRATYGEKCHKFAGQKMPVLLTECRFVRPIKGDRLGRVTYSDERVLLHVFRP